MSKSSAEIDLRYSTIWQRSELFPGDLPKVSEIFFKNKFGRSQQDALYGYLDKVAPRVSVLPVTRSLITILMEASLDFKPAIYKRLQELVSIFNANGDLKPIEDLVQKVSLTEERLRNKNDNKREDNAEYALQVRLEAIKAVFGSK